jgi:hypothetical protein
MLIRQALVEDETAEPYLQACFYDCSSQSVDDLQAKLELIQAISHALDWYFFLHKKNTRDVQP